MEYKLQEEINNLPPLKSSILKIQNLLDSSELDIVKLANIIEEDPFMKVDLLKEANSPYYGLRSTITSVKKVISLFGLNKIRSLIYLNILKSQIKSDFSAYNLTSEEFINYIHNKRKFFKIWFNKEFHNFGELNKYIDSILFIEDIGKVVLDNIAEEEGYLDIMKHLINEGKSISEVEYDIFETTSHEISYKILRKWNFPSEIYRPIKEYNIVETSNILDLNLFTKIIRVVNKVIDIHSNINEKKGIEEALRFGFNPENIFDSIAEFKSQ